MGSDDVSFPDWERVPGKGEVSAEMSSGGRVHILAVDLGVNNNILRYLVYMLRVDVTVVPWDYDFTEDSSTDFS